MSSFTGPGGGQVLIGVAAPAVSTALAAGATAAGPVYFVAGTQGAPGIAFSSDHSAGFWLSGGGNVVAVNGGVIHLFFGGSELNVTVPLVLSARLITTMATPASSSASGTAGQFAFDGTYAYFCVSTNTWGRIPIVLTPF